MARLEVQHVSKTFEAVRAVQDVSLTVEDGQFAAILGPSGCGKTTLLRIIAGFAQPESGRVLVDGRDITSLPPDKRRMGLVFQSYALFPHLTVAENIAYGLRARKVPRAVIRAKVEEALALVRLPGLGNRKPSQISGGQQQRVALARALVIEPDILLLDEPLSALDRAIRLEMQGELRRIQHEVGITTVFVTHDQEEALTLSNQVVVMRDGLVQQRGRPEHLYLQPANQFVSGFLGAANVIRGRIEERPGGTWCLVDGALAWPVERNTSLHPGEEAEAIVRPEWLSLRSAGEGGDGALRGTVTATRFAGPTCEVTVQAGEIVLRVLTLFVRHEWEEGEQVDVVPERADIPLYSPAQFEGREQA